MSIVHDRSNVLLQRSSMFVNRAPFPFLLVNVEDKLSCQNLLETDELAQSAKFIIMPCFRGPWKFE